MPNMDLLELIQAVVAHRRAYEALLRDVASYIRQSPPFPGDAELAAKISSAAADASLSPELVCKLMDLASGVVVEERRS